MAAICHSNSMRLHAAGESYDVNYTNTDRRTLLNIDSIQCVSADQMLSRQHSTIPVYNNTVQ
jgi:hypothetical protein